MPIMSVRMSLDELKRFYNKVRLQITHISAFDLASHEWIYGKQVLTKERPYSLVVLTFRNGHKLRIEILPQMKPLLKISKKFISNPNIWKTYFGVSLTAEEFVLLEKLNQKLPEFFTLVDLINTINEEIEKLGALREKFEKLQRKQ